SGVIQTENALLVGRSLTRPGPRTSTQRFIYDVIELSDPTAPTLASRFEVPASLMSYGWGYFGVGGCMVDAGWGWYGGGESAQLTDGDLVVSQHAEPVPGSDREVRYYLDRIDVSDPHDPV